MTAIVIERTIPRAPRDVFEAWLDPRTLAMFMCPTEGTRVSKVEVDPRVGGEFLIVMTIGGADLPHHGAYLEIARYTHLAFTWRSHAAGEGSRVRLRFEPLGAEQTRLILEHVGLDEPAARRRHVAGWTQILDTLAASQGRWVAAGADVER